MHMKSNFRINIIAISVLFSIILITTVYFTYYHNVNILKKEILKEYLAVYIDTRKNHLEDLVNNVYTDIDAKRKNLKANIEKELDNYINIAENVANSLESKNKGREIPTVIKSINKDLCGKHIKIFIIDEKSKAFIVKPSFNIDEKALLSGGNSNFISKYTVYKPKKWIIGAVAYYEKFENDLKRYVLNRLYHFRYGLQNEGYFFVIYVEKKNDKIITRRLLNPNKPKSSIGKTMPLGMKDEKGKQFFRYMVEKCLTKGQGFEKYYFKLIGTNKITEKVSFFKYYKPWHWMIGTGFYITIFKTQLKKRNKILRAIMLKRNERFLLILVLSFGLITFIFVHVIYLFTNKINRYIKRVNEDNRFKQKLIYMIPNPMFFSDDKGNILECNEDLKELFSIKETDECSSLKNDDLRNLEIKLKQALEESKVKHKEIPEAIEIKMKIRGKEKKVFDLYISQLQYKKKLSGFVCILIDITERKESQEKLYKASIKDELTNAFNRRYLKNLFPTEHKKAQDKNYKISLIMFDIDFFKKINDTYGHDVGDKVLTKVVEIAEKHIRKEDFLFRIGGEEFVIMLAGAGKDKAYQIAEEIRENIKNYTFEESFNVTVSFGVVEVEKGDNLKSALKKADKALYESKNTGRDKTTMHNPDRLVRL